MSERRIDEIVAKEIGQAYVFVVASGISQYLAAKGNPAVSEVDIAQLAVKSKRLYDAHEKVFASSSRLPIGTRREIVRMFLLGEDVSGVLNDLGRSVVTP